MIKLHFNHWASIFPKVIIAIWSLLHCDNNPYPFWKFLLKSKITHYLLLSNIDELLNVWEYHHYLRVIHNLFFDDIIANIEPVWEKLPESFIWYLYFLFYIQFFSKFLKDSVDAKSVIDTVPTRWWKMVQEDIFVCLMQIILGSLLILLVISNGTFDIQSISKATSLLQTLPL